MLESVWHSVSLAVFLQQENASSGTDLLTAVNEVALLDSIRYELLQRVDAVE